MKIQANQIRPGMIIEHDGRQWSVLKIQLIQPGKGGAFNQVEMRDLKARSKTNVRWRTQDTVEKLTTNEQEYQFLYSSGDVFTFMDPKNYEQLTLHRDIIAEEAIYLQDGMLVTVKAVENIPIGITLPATLTLEVIETEPVVKGQTAASSSKPAILENGLRVMVPPFVGRGTRIVINTADGTYIKRADQQP